MSHHVYAIHHEPFTHDEYLAALPIRLHRPNAFRARCSCGWTGKPWNTSAPAHEEGKHHEQLQATHPPDETTMPEDNE